MSIAAVLALLNSPIGASLIAALGAWITGKGVTMMMNSKAFSKYVGWFLQTAKAPAALFVGLFHVGVIQFLLAPILGVFLLALFWGFTFLDKCLESSSPGVRDFLTGLQQAVAATGSTDRALYLQAKTMPEHQVDAVSKMAAAVAAPAGSLDQAQATALSMAREAGRALIDAKLQQD